MLKNKLHIVMSGVAICILLISFGCTSNGDSTPPATYMQISSTSPADEDTGVAVASTISVLFNKTLDSSSISSSNVYLQDSGENFVSASLRLSTSLETVYLVPDSDLAEAETYTLTITGITGSGGEYMRTDPRTVSFTTYAPGEDGAPGITEKYPIDNSTEVNYQIVPQITFSKEIDEASVVQSNIYLYDVDNQTTINGWLQLDTTGCIVTFNPQTGLNVNSSYVLYIQNVADTEGNIMPSQDTITFYTGDTASQSFAVSSVSPADSASDISKNARIRIVFPRDIISSTVNADNISVTETSGGTNVEGTLSVGFEGNFALFSPTYTFSDSTSYTVTVENVQDLYSNIMSGQETFSFETGTTLDVTPPSKIDDLIVLNSRGIFGWTAPGDDSTTGTAYYYELRYSTSPIDESNFSDATRIDGVSFPQVQGTSETVTTYDLGFNTTYYFAVRAYDEAYNASALSSVITSEAIFGDHKELAPDLANANGGRYAAAYLGDVNNDGLGDMAYGAYGYDSPDTDAGGVFVHYGTASGLLSTPDAVLTGVLAGDGFGMSIAGNMDLNGDGAMDIVVGAPNRDDDDVLNNGATNNGGVYVFFGGASGISSGTGSAADVIIIGSPIANDYCGYSVINLGDVSPVPDGIDDLMISAYQNDIDGTNYGTVYIFYGGGTNFPAVGSAQVTLNITNTLSTSDADITITGQGGNFGQKILGNMDLNNDGYKDFIVSSYILESNAQLPDTGFIYCFYGSSTGFVTGNYLDADFTMEGELGGGYFGSDFTAGDFNNDGYDDLWVSARQASSGSLYENGRIYMFYGSVNGITATVPGDADCYINGSTGSDLLGMSIHSVGDLNNDGYDDVAFASENYDQGLYADVGRVYIIYGGLFPTSGDVETLADFTMTGYEAATNYFGSALASGDTNNDGFIDIAVGAYGGDAGANNSGLLWVAY